MEHEKYELIEDQPGSDEEVSAEEEEGGISEYSTGDKCVERISYTKVVHCVMEFTVSYHCSYQRELMIMKSLTKTS